ncbi:hypothetical protein LWI28_027405 [Acer negundo]|uniref:Uncharacterized protein n=1 Tax=Acer negundo TaxID=4023 RepID=A0AAD5NLL2_ACENE|nr:hypothetical protein LWI28_027405 [Acer negundo]KAK4857890.1 hypothetical protein QYF36_007752 [Acer negundo]
METPEASSVGLKALTICSENDHHHHHNSCLMSSNQFPPPILSTPSYSHHDMISYHIGTESCDELIKNYPDHHQDDHVNCLRLKTKKKKKKAEYPPLVPMTSLPFVLKRNCTRDGNLILTMEKRHDDDDEYMKAHRSNGPR